MGLAELVSNLVAILRYLAPPVVALCILWLLDQHHDVVSSAVERAWPAACTGSVWPLVLFTAVLAIFGGLIYHAHRTVWHSIRKRILFPVCTRDLSADNLVCTRDFSADKKAWRRLQKVILFLSCECVAKQPQNTPPTKNTPPTFEDLDFARWVRRAPAKGMKAKPEHAEAHAVQTVLDEISAVSDFFYCSAWATLVLYLSLKLFFPCYLQLSCCRCLLLVVLFVAFFVLGVTVDVRTTMLDLKAYDRFKNCH